MFPVGVPNRRLTDIVDLVLGPVIVNVVKSRRSEHISVEGQTVKLHEFAVVGKVVGVVHAVLFSVVVFSHALTTNMQQTPNPSAQDPELVPLLSAHS